MGTIYAPGPYYKRVRTFLREFHPPRVPMRLSFRNLMALARSSVRLGVVGRERFHYWGLLAWTACRRPALIQTAVTLAIYGHHFRRCAAALGA
jgi:hypothetical protein